MKKLFFGIAAVLLMSLTSVNADITVGVDLTANGDGRFYDWFSAGYAQVDSPTGAQFANGDPTSANGMFGVGTTTLQGSEVFTFNGGDWSGVGSIVVSGNLTGSGNETLSATSATFDFNPYIEGGKLSIAGAPYTTTLSNVTGSISFSNGVVSSIDINSDVAFQFTGFDPFDGVFSITNNVFDLAVDETVSGVRHEWDFDGSASGIVAVPEPSAGFVLIAVGSFLFGRRRKI